MLEKVELSWRDLRDLDLDPQNPRHVPGLNRAEVIAQFVKRENIYELARDIVTNGLSPLESFGAITDAQNELVIVEGNRRLCALMLLHDPALAPTPVDRKRFERLQKRFDPSGIKLEVAVFEDRDEAQVWLERKHMGQNNGLGTRGWNAVQQERAFGTTGNALALALIDYALDNGLVDESPVLTTVTRFMSNPYVRRHSLLIQTGVGEAKFKFAGTRSLFDRRLKTLLTDIIAGANGATSRTKATDREKYAKARLDVLQDDPTDVLLDDADADTDADAEVEQQNGEKAGEEERPGADAQDGTGGSEGSEGEPNSEEGGDASSRNTDPGKRSKLLSPDFQPPLRDLGLRRILHELHLVGKRTPILAAVGVRIFLEAIAVSYIESQIERSVGDREKLHQLVHEALGHLGERHKRGELRLTSKERAALTMLKNKAGEPSFIYSAAYLGAVAHNSAYPQWPTLTAAWDEIAPVVHVLAANCEEPLGSR